MGGLGGTLHIETAGQAQPCARLLLRGTVVRRTYADKLETLQRQSGAALRRSCRHTQSRLFALLSGSPYSVIPDRATVRLSVPHIRASADQLVSDGPCVGV